MLVKCESCRNDFNKPRCHIGRNKYHFCKRSCRDDWQKSRMLGTKNPNWKGGNRRHVSRSGYVRIGAIYEHIIIAEQKYGFSTKGYHVHHLNGIRDDNRPENLVIVKPKDHEGNTFRKILQSKIREMEQTILDLKKSPPSTLK